MSCRSSETVERVWVHSPCVQFGSIEHTCRTIECGDTTANTDVNQNLAFRRKWHSFPSLKKHSSIKCVDTFSRDHKTLRQKKRKTILISQFSQENYFEQSLLKYKLLKKNVELFPRRRVSISSCSFDDPESDTDSDYEHMDPELKAIMR